MAPSALPAGSVEHVEHVGDSAIELRIPSRLGWERAAMDLAASVARRMGFPDDRIEDIKSAVAEATANAIEHGNRGAAEHKVLVVLAPEGERLEIKVRDKSPVPFPMSGGMATAPGAGAGAAPAPSIADKLAGRSNARGWGMFLIQELVDEVEFTSSGTGNQVRMVINVAPPAR